MVAAGETAVNAGWSLARGHGCKEAKIAWRGVFVHLVLPHVHVLMVLHVGLRCLHGRENPLAVRVCPSHSVSIGKSQF